jgi:hypothetical protein
MIELLDPHPDTAVPEAEYHRLLGYPRGHLLGERALELAAWARRWFAEHGRPWIYLREVELRLTPDTLHLDGVAFASPQLRDHLTHHEAARAMLVAVSAGRAAEEHARGLWDAGKPDEYFFLEIYASAVVERIVATTSGRLCDLAGRDGLIAVPHYSPGYSGWDVADQTKLFECIAGGAQKTFPEKLEVLSSGMLRPKKSLLGVFGLTARTPRALAVARATPCAQCALTPCRYRRAAYRHESPTPAALNGRSPELKYSVNSRALAKWARERVRIETKADGVIAATFRFDGTTCSNLGQSLVFDYSVTLGTASEGFPIRETDCRPATGDEGHKKMCSYLSDAPALMQAIATEKPLLGRPLGDVLHWTRPAAPAGCHCDAASRAHKWGLALEAIHFALAQRPAPRAAAPEPITPSP